ncbi:hypothetical protein HK104_009456 [Borealophlyctis nickersoniae]|nr:hypothetical protein HK104_009456 [Borealophlyctis nickersoniae]
MSDPSSRSNWRWPDAQRQQQPPISSEVEEKLRQSFSFSFEAALASNLSRAGELGTPTKPDPNAVKEAHASLDRGFDNLFKQIDEVNGACKAKMARQLIQRQLAELPDPIEYQRVSIPKERVDGDTARRLNASRRLAILRHTESALQLEIEKLENRQDIVILKHPAVYDAEARQEVVDVVADYQGHNGLPRLYDNINKMQARLESQDREEAHLHQVRDHIAKGLGEAGDLASGTARTSQQEIVARLEAEEARYMSALKRLVYEHFDMELEAANGKRKAPSDEATSRCVNFVERLVLQSLTNPGDPYITLTDGECPQPLIEALVKADVAIFDTGDSGRLRLNDFHE